MAKAPKHDEAGSRPKKQTNRERQLEANRRRARKRTFRNWSIGAAVVLVVVGAVVWGEVTKATGTTDITDWDLPAIGSTADLQERVALTDFRGKPTVVNFFASWCIECDRELPGFRAVSAELADTVNFVGIASQETGNALSMPQRHDITDWPLAQDVGGRNRSGLSEALGARGMPLTAFYSADGEFLEVRLGSMSEAELRSIINRLYGIGA
jgi:cytochrome c biogenesis protein CcmG/thiol:disulfide interchange protein DsbE